ncbi:hypothetical protein [Aerococcus tenax]|uniref:hypothetical protein n=1 Tax=Aerococcus tenax TaxID=3078812 RepID=UPI0018A6D8AF|nr:hypothetical protein [Aerococcus tenax]
MSQTVYTVYWENKRDGVRKEHGTFASEEEALAGIKAWWELQKDKYDNVQTVRTNTGALEIQYEDDNYVYRIEEEQLDGQLPKKSYTLRKAGQIEAERNKYDVDDDYCLFDELAEPYRDRLIVAMNDSQKARQYIYNERGQLIKKLDQ